MDEPTTTTIQWTGTTSEDWADDGNWSIGAAPSAGVETHIDTSAPRDTVLGVSGPAAGACGKLWIGSASGANSNLAVQSQSSLTTTDVYVGDNGGIGYVLVDSGATVITARHVLLGVFPPPEGARSDGVWTGSASVKGGGRWSADTVVVGSGGSGSLVIYEGGTVRAATTTNVGLSEGSTGDLIIQDLGTLETACVAVVSGTGRVVFDGATLRATAGVPDWILITGFPRDKAIIGAGGLTIDDGGFVVCVQSPLSGVGWLTKTGDGTLRLAADHTYEAGTTVKAGTLEIADGSVLGDISLAAGASVVFSVDCQFGGLISGEGRVELRSGDLYFLRDHTYTGGTTISGGTILLGKNSPQGSIVGDVVVEEGGSLYFWRSDTYTFDGVISGPGGVREDGAGAVVLTAASSYTGPTTVLAGTLVVNGSIVSPTTVNAGGTLAGTGTISNAVTSAGTIAPGPGATEVGTLTIDGNCTFNGGALAVKVKLDSDASPADLLRITGDTVSSGEPIQVLVTNLSGEGAETTGDGIKIVDVHGASAADVFVLGSKVSVGTHVYELFRGGVTDPNDGNWYLRTVVTQASV